MASLDFQFTMMSDGWKTGQREQIIDCCDEISDTRFCGARWAVIHTVSKLGAVTTEQGEKLENFL